MGHDTAGQPETLILQLAQGFDALREQYSILHARCRSLEDKLNAVRKQMKRQHESVIADYAPDSVQSVLRSALDKATAPTEKPPLTSEAWRFSSLDNVDTGSGSHARVIQAAEEAASVLRSRITTSTSGAKIHSAPSADKIEPPPMPSISESPLEQDFTTAGKPSNLGCPFTSMSGRRLSSHAASIVSRYRPNSTPLSSVSRAPSRISGRLHAKGPLNIPDPMLAETCALEKMTSPTIAASANEPAQNANVCPIRFLDQHSPEEVAAYFEQHKHELPRSHAVCVQRYQSNEESIRKLDAKYGNLVSMIQGLGAKHQRMLPEQPEDEPAPEEKEGRDRVGTWAKAVSAVAVNGTVDPEATEQEDHERQGRQQQFERPLRDVRLGESPSRPWGIPVPARAERVPSAVSSASAEIADAQALEVKKPVRTEKPRDRPEGRCPFSFGNAPMPDDHPQAEKETPDPKTSTADPEPVIVKPSTAHPDAVPTNVKQQPQMLFTGPVFIGYPVEQALELLEQSRLHAKT
ncbi:hypothetical protein LTR28_005478 [Elasticomyces elasticus]|nr:hypothetical protein LTR28_005478 [Elasticomyces elasticus]